LPSAVRAYPLLGNLWASVDPELSREAPLLNWFEDGNLQQIEDCQGWIRKGALGVKMGHQPKTGIYNNILIDNYYMHMLFLL
jgi:hypothetical protein